MYITSEQDNPLADQAVFTESPVQKWLPFLYLWCLFCMLGLIAMIVILSLIPTYLPKSNLVDIKTNSFNIALNVTYTTNFKSSNSSAVPNTNTIGTNLMKEFPLADIIIGTSKFIPLVSTSASKRRRAIETINNACEIDPGTAGDFLSIEVSIKYRLSCSSVVCQNNFNETVESITAALRLNRTIPVTLANGSTITIQLVFCSFGQIQQGLPNLPLTTTTVTITATSIIITNISPTAASTPIDATTTAPITTTAPTTTMAPTTVLTTPVYIPCPSIFAPMVPYSTGANSGPQGMSIGDFNGDGIKDLVVANRQSGTVKILFGDVSGTFKVPAVTIETGLTNPYDVATGNFNGDTNLDIVTSAYGDNQLHILLGNGGGTFGSPTFISTSHPTSTAISDFNGDGNMDLVTASFMSSAIFIFNGDGTGQFGMAKQYTVDTKPFSFAINDFNRDGRKDIAIANSAPGKVDVLLNQNNGIFGPFTGYPIGINTNSVASGYFNGDGNVDLATVAYTPPSVSVLIGDGTGNFAPAVYYTMDPNSDCHSVAVGDFNADGKLDLVVANFGSNNTGLLIGNGDGTFTSQMVCSAGAGPFMLIVDDFNGDNKLDLAVTNNNGANVGIFLNIF